MPVQIWILYTVVYKMGRRNLADIDRIALQSRKADLLRPTHDQFILQHNLQMNPMNGKMHDGVCGGRNGFVVEWDE
jgi:hypothetical protein